MTKRVVCLIGESASGKSTIEKELCKLDGFRKAISHTTRAMREGEVHGEDYWFVSDSKFLFLDNFQRFAETTEYNGWKYGVSKEELLRGDDIVVLVIEPVGFKQLLENTRDLDIEILSFYIHTRGKERLLRSLHREVDPDCKEICRRFLSDIDLFNGVEDKVDYIIDNGSKSLEESTQEVLTKIRQKCIMS